MSHSVPARFGPASCCFRAAGTSCAPSLIPSSGSAGADEGFGSSTRPKANSGALTPPKPCSDGGADCASPKTRRSSRAGGCCPALGLPPRVESSRRERLDAQMPVAGAAEEQAGVANAECGHTVSPSKRRRRRFSPGCSNLGKMKRSIMHLSLHSHSQAGRTRAESPHV